MKKTIEEWLFLKKHQPIEKCIFKQQQIEEIIQIILCILFPGVYDEVLDKNNYLESLIFVLKEKLLDLLKHLEQVQQFSSTKEDIVKKIIEELPIIEEHILLDIDALFEGDPSATSKLEIILCSPGFYAILIYRIAHTFTELDIKILPKMLSEYAHSKTGIDINPKAKIGKYFFIDHGTGVVIGETTMIGDHVKIYHGVTLGALSLKEGHKLQGTKRHPTILDGVTIYANASILGGKTIIGPNVTIKSNALITTSILGDENKDFIGGTYENRIF